MEVTACNDTQKAKGEKKCQSKVTNACAPLEISTKEYWKQLSW